MRRRFFYHLNAGAAKAGMQEVHAATLVFVTIIAHFFNKHFRYLPLICRRTKAAVYKTQTAS
jgi:hypothetical protein